MLSAGSTSVYVCKERTAGRVRREASRTVMVQGSPKKLPAILVPVLIIEQCTLILRRALAERGKSKELASATK